jgi:isopropylmalate/homocitrate/citramalate synthase
MPGQGLPPRVFINEAAPRDGLQIEPCFVPTARKIAFIDELSLTGLAKIEATSFSSAKSIPSLAEVPADRLFSGGCAHCRAGYWPPLQSAGIRKMKKDVLF